MTDDQRSHGEPAGSWETWSRFPLHARPRPVILVDQPVHLGLGFVDAISSVAYTPGAVTADVELPDGVLALLTGGRHGHAEQPLCAVGVRPVSASFVCDRGPRDLPAFAVEVTGVRQPVVVLDPSVEIWWPANGAWHQSHWGDRAEVEPDGTTVHYWVHGGERTEFFGASFREFATYVVVSPVFRQRPFKPGESDGLTARHTRITGRLTAPLGDRVLLNEGGWPLVVTTAVSQ
jgi:hypothetical protein